MIKNYLLLFIATALSSCETRDMLEDGNHKAYIEAFKTTTGTTTLFAAEVLIKNGVIKSINIDSTRIIGNFDFWETRTKTCQDAYNNRDTVYRVHIIEESEF